MSNGQTANQDVALEEIRRSMEDIKDRMQRIAAPYEDALSQRVFDQGKKKLTIYFGVWFGVITGALTFLGFNAYEKIVNGATELAAKEYSEKAMPELKQKVEELIKTKAGKYLEERFKSFELSSQTQIDTQVSQAVSAAQKNADVKLNQALEEIGDKFQDDKFAHRTQEKIEEASRKEQSEAAQLWSYYGSMNADGTWRKKVFLLYGGDNMSDAAPTPGDRAKAITDVNMRSAPPEYSSGSGWEFAPIQSIIGYGEVVAIDDVETIETPDGKYFWIRLSR